MICRQREIFRLGSKYFKKKIQTNSSFSNCFRITFRKTRDNYPNCPNTCPPLRQKNFLVFTRGGGIIRNFHFFDSRPFQMSSSELKLYFTTYYRPLVYFEVFFTYSSLSTNLCGHQKKAKKTFFGFFGFFEFFFFLVFARGQLF